MEVLPKRFGKYGLAIHPDKTRLVPFALRFILPSEVDSPARGSATGSETPERVQNLSQIASLQVTLRGRYR
jgi:hypothetical protein